MPFCLQLRLMLRKSWIVKKRQPSGLCCEIFLPVIFMGLLVYLRTRAETTSTPDTFPPPQPVMPLPVFLNTSGAGEQIAFVPPPGQPLSSLTPIIDFLKELAYPQHFPYALYESADAVVDYVLDPRMGDPGYPTVGAMVAFNNLGGATGRDWSYTLRLSATDVADTSKAVDPLQVGLPANYTLYLYNLAGFTALQNALDMYILANATGQAWSALAPTLPLQAIMAFPHQAVTQDNFQSVIENVLPFFLMIAYMYPFSRLVKDIVEEKEQRIKEGMKTMGLTDGVFWCSWIITYSLIYGTTAVLNSIVLTGGGVFKYTPFGMVLFWLLAFSVSMIAGAMLISTFFSTAKVAGVLSLFVFFCTFLPYFAVNKPNMGAAVTWACLLAPTAFGMGSNNLSVFEGGQQGVTLANWSQPVNGFAFSTSILMMLVDTLLYGVLTWYLDKTLPSEFGTRHVPWFCVTKRYWTETLDCCGPGPSATGHDSAAAKAARSAASHSHADAINGGGGGGIGMGHAGDLKEALIDVPGGGVSAAERSQEELLREYPDAPLADNCEEVGQDLRKRRDGVHIRHLRKAFDVNGKTVVAVDDLSLDMYKGQVFCLLGHNGAGKTTTINMMTGMYESTSGDALIGGRSMLRDMPGIRQNIGLCPQFSILFGLLTVQEHLELFATLKGVPSDALAREVEQTLDDIKLRGQKDVFANSLSGGSRRKLSVGMALIGGSEIVFLDEPTSGMDPFSRKETQELIRRSKAGRVIVLTTHYMEEADLLADRLAIMAHGQLKACGSSLYLKSKFGVGYTLLLSKRDAGSNEPGILETVKRHSPTSEVLSNVGTEISWRLPFDDSKHFSALFGALDAASDALGIDNYGISVTTLEEVFLRVTKADAEEHAENQRHAKKEARKKRNQDLKYDPDEFQSTTSTDITPQPSPMLGKHKSLNQAGSHGHTVYSSLAAADGASAFVSVPNTPNPKRGGYGTTAAVAAAGAGGAVGGSAGGAAAGADKKTGGADGDSMWTGDALDERRWFGQHFFALFMKRFLVAKRDRKALIFQLVIPVAALALGLFLVTLTHDEFVDLVLDPAAEYSNPTELPYNLYGAGPAPFNGSGLDWVAGGGLVPTPTPTYDWATMSHWLLDNRLEGGTARYGAIVNNRVGNTTVGGPALSTVVVAFNATGLHAMPTFLNTLHTSWLRALTGDAGARITVHDYPFPRHGKDKEQIESGNGFTVATIIVLAFAFIPASYARFVVAERATKAKHQQLVSGVEGAAYWLSTYAWDLCNYLVPMVFSAAIILAFNNASFVGVNFGATILSFLLYGFSVISFSYFLSFAFDEPGGAQNILLLVYFATGLVLLIVSVVLNAFDSTKHVNGSLVYLYRLFPNFCLGDALYNLAVRNQPLLFLDGQTHGPWDWVVTGADLFFMATEAVVYLALTMLWEKFNATPQCVSRFRPDPPVPEPSPEAQAMQLALQTAIHGAAGVEDSDVKEERRRIVAGETPHDVIVIEGLRKVYAPAAAHGIPKVAVKELYFGVTANQCFGFLGSNGAGKTTTLSVLSGEFPPSDGTAFLGGFNILNQQKEVRRLMGYCPQFDALFDLMTGYEHLELYAKIKGVQPDHIASVVRNMLRELSLEQYADKPAGTYSGGNKRKLSVACALIGSPAIVFLDEPSTGMDPVSRRFMWNFIARTMKGRSVILTTQSMDECEALCNRIGIMVNGELKCLGSANHLKSKYGQGYALDLKTGDTKEHDDRIRANVPLWFPGARIVEAHGGTFKYHLPAAKDRRLSQLFDAIESRRKEFAIVEYSVSPTTLEQVFVYFAKSQAEDTRAGPA